MLMTEQYLLELKYNRANKYYGQFLSSIFFDELKRIKQYKPVNLMNAIQPFFHRLVEANIWQVKFSDNSVMLIKYENNIYYISVFQTHDDIFHDDRSCGEFGCSG